MMSFRLREDAGAQARERTPMNRLMQNDIRVFLADDHPAVRQGLSLLMAQENIVVCAEAETCEEALARIDAAGADVAVVDLSLGEESGLELITELTGRNIPVLVYSMHEDPESIEQCFKRGALGYVSKRDEAFALPRAIREVQAGKRHISPRAAQSLASQALKPKQAQAAPSLSAREMQTLALLGQGDSNKDIADKLGLSVRTVESYFARIIEKIGVEGMKELRKHAIRIQK